MNRFSSLFVLALASCIVLKSAAQPCTPATCPSGPVIARFEYSNCTGEVTYSSLLSVAEMECQADETHSAFAHYDSNGIYSYSSINNLNCDLTRFNSSYALFTYWFGTCLPPGPFRKDASRLGPLELLQQRDHLVIGASMYLYSVNSSIVAPQESQEPGNPKNLTSYLAAVQSFSCYSLLNCSREDGTTPDLISSTYSERGNCSSGEGSYYTDGQIGVCYFDSDLYFSFACSTDHGYAVNVFVDDNCQKRYVTQAFVFPCSNTFSSTGYQCTSPLGPVTPLPSPPSSSSSSLSITPIAIILTLIFLLHGF